MISYGYQPMYSQEQVSQYLQYYNQSPHKFDDKQTEMLKMHAEYYQMPFAKGAFDKSFDILRAVKQAGEGYLSGFTTLNIGEQSPNPIERVIRSAATLLGYVGYVPATGISLATKATAIAAKKMFGLTAQAASRFVISKAAAKGITSVPMLGAKIVSKQAAKLVKPLTSMAAASHSAAFKTVIGFLNKEIPTNIIQSSFHLGTASAISNWQYGIDAMMKGFIGGAQTGAAFGAMGNLFQQDSGYAMKAARTLAFSLYTGLPSTARAESTPQQVYDYMLGGYFGMKSKPAYKQSAMRFVGEYAKDRYTAGKWVKPETVEGWENLSPKAKMTAENIILKDYGQTEAMIIAQRVIKNLGGKITGKAALGAVYKEIEKLETQSIIQTKDAEGKPLDEFQVTKARFLLAENNIMKNAIETIEAAKTAGIDSGDIGELNNISSESQNIMKFVGKSILGKEYNHANTKDKKIYDTIYAKWNRIQPLGDAQNHTDKMIKWLKTKTAGQINLTEKDLQMWYEAGIRRTQDKQIMLYEVKSIMGATYKIDEFGTRRKTTKRAGFQVNLINPETNRTDTGDLRSMYRPLSEISEAYDRAVVELYGKEPDVGPIQPKTPSMVILDSGTVVSTTQRPYYDTNTKTIKYKNINRKYTGGLFDLRITPQEQGNILLDFSKRGYLLFGGYSDKEAQVYTKPHPRLDNMGDPGIHRAYSGINKMVVNAINKSLKSGEAKASINDLEKNKILFLKMFKYQDKDVAERMFEKMYISNTLYALSLNKMDIKSNENIIKLVGSGFVNTPKGFNKRMQIWMTGGYRIPEEAARKALGWTKKSQQHRVVLLNDVQTDKQILKYLDTLAEKYPESTDGVQFVLPEELAVYNRLMGLNPSGQMMKPFVVSSDPEHGALLGKLLMVAPPPEMAEFMRSKGINSFMYKSAAKQTGTRKSYDLTYKDGKLSLGADKIESYVLPLGHIKVVTTKKYGPKDLEDQSLYKQLLTNLTPYAKNPIHPDTMRNMFSDIIENKFGGTQEYNNKLSDIMLNPKNEDLHEDVINNLDKVGVQQLFNAIKAKGNERFAAKALRKILNVHADNLAEENVENIDTSNEGMKEIALARIGQSSVSKFLEDSDGKLFSFLHKFAVKGYVRSALNGYVRNRITKPKLENSVRAILRPLDVVALNTYAKDININEPGKGDDLYYLGGLFKDKIIISTTLFPKEGKGRLESIWNNYKSGKYTKEQEAKAKDVLNALVVRAPMDSLSGAQSLQCGGFTTIDDYGILVHGRTMEAFGGADLDGDDVVVYFGGNSGMKKAWKKMYADQKKEFVKTDKKEPPKPKIKDYINHSGGAIGADTFWDVAGKKFGMVKNKHYYVEGNKTPKGNTPISRKLAMEADVELKEANKVLGKRFPTSNEYVNNLLRRNWQQVKNSDAVFAISTIKDNKVEGGTGWAVHMAINNKKPVYVFDQIKRKWFTWKDNAFIKSDTPILTKNFAGIGTRNLTAEGKQAIEDVYKRSIGESVQFTPSVKTDKIGREYIAPSAEHVDPITGKTYDSMNLAKKDAIHKEQYVDKRSLLFSPIARMYASEMAYSGRKKLGIAVNNKSIIMAAHIEMMRRPKDKRAFFYSFRRDDGTRVSVMQTHKQYARDMERFLGITKSAVRLASDPMDSGEIASNDVLFENAVDALFNFEAHIVKYNKETNKYDKVKETKIGSQEKRKGFTNIIADINRAMFGKNHEEHRQLSEMEIRDMLSKAEAEIYNPVTSYGLSVPLMNSVSWTDSMLSRFDSDGMNKLYRYYENVLKSGRLDNINKMLKLEDKKFHIPQSDLVKFLKSYNLDTIENQRVLLSTYEKTTQNLFKQKFYQKLHETNKTRYPDFETYKRLDIADRMKLIANLTDTANDYLTNDIGDMVGALSISTASRELKISQERLDTLFSQANKIKVKKMLLDRERNVTAFEMMSESDVLKMHSELKKLPKSMAGKTVNSMAEEFKQDMTRGERYLFDLMLISPLQHKGKTLYNRIGLELDTISSAARKTFYGIFDQLFDESVRASNVKFNKKAVENMAEIFTSLNATDTEFLDVGKLEKIQELRDSVVFNDLHNKKGVLRNNAEDVYTRIMAAIEGHKGINKYILPGMFRYYTGRNINNADLGHMRVFANQLEALNSGFKSPVMRKFMWWLFPKAVGDKYLKYSIDFQKGISPYWDKDGVLRENGINLQPVHTIHKLQKAAERMADAVTKISERMTYQFKEDIEPFVYAIDDGRELWEAMIGTMEAPNITRISKIHRDSPVLIQNYTEGYVKNLEYAKKIIAKNGDKIYNVRFKEKGNVISKKFTGKQVIKEMNKIYQKYREMTYEWLHGQPEYLDEFYIKRYLVKEVDRGKGKFKHRIGAKRLWDSKDHVDYKKKIKEGYIPEGDILAHYNTNDPMINYDKFLDAMDNYFLQGKTPPMALGIDNLRKIQKSLLYSINRGNPEKIKRLMFMQILPTGDLGSSYWPHEMLSHDMTVKTFIEMSKKIERSDMPIDAKKKEIYKLCYRAGKDSYDHLKENISDELWQVLGLPLESKGINKSEAAWLEHNAMMQNQLPRQSHISGWDLSPEVVERYMNRAARTFYRHIAQIDSHRQMQRFKEMNINKKNPDGSQMYPAPLLDRWIKFLNLRTLANLGFPSVVPKEILEDPGMKIKGTPYGWWNDSVVTDFLNKTMDRLGMKRESNVYRYRMHVGENNGIVTIKGDRVIEVSGNIDSSWVGEDWGKFKAGAYPGQKMQLKLTKGSEPTTLSEKIARKLSIYELTPQDIIHFSGMEAKYELMSLLAHPKFSMGNIYGGTSNTIISTGLENYRKARNIKYLRQINPDWDSMAKVGKWNIQIGVVEDFLLHNIGMVPHHLTVQMKGFYKEAVAKISKNPEMSDVTLKSIAEKYKISDNLFDKAAWFMRASERILRRDAFMSHYVQARELWGNRLRYDHPFLIQQGLLGVRGTQFLYSAAQRPMFASTAFGKVMTRFQLWAWNSVRFRNDIKQEAAIYGYAEGTPAYDRFKRMITMDAMMIAAASAFMYTIFEAALPAPYSWFQDFADWIFGDEKERDRAFFGSYPSAVAPLQMFTPPILRMVGPTVNAFMKNDFAKLGDYYVWTMFPFGRIGRDLMGKNNLFINPSRIIEKMTGIPYRQFGEQSVELRKRGPELMHKGLLGI